MNRQIILAFMVLGLFCIGCAPEMVGTWDVTAEEDGMSFNSSILTIETQTGYEIAGYFYWDSDGVGCSGRENFTGEIQSDNTVILYGTELVNSDCSLCDYTGTISPDGNSITDGTYFNYEYPGFTWSAEKLQ